MGLARALRRSRRRQEPQIDEILSTMIASAEELAENLFQGFLRSGEEMPPRSSVENDMKTIFMAMLGPPTPAAVADLLSSRIQLAFQARWTVLEERHAALSAVDDARPH